MTSGTSVCRGEEGGRHPHRRPRTSTPAEPRRAKSRCRTMSIPKMRPSEADSWCQGVYTVAPRATITAARPAAHYRAAAFSEYGGHRRIDATDSQPLCVRACKA